MSNTESLPSDPNFLDKEKGNGCHYTTQEIADQKKFVWKIKKWSEIKNQERIFSEEFEVGKSKWKLLLFPNGVSRNSDISLFLYSVNANMENCSPQWACCSHFSLAIANSKNDKVFLKKDAHHRFNKKENDWGFKNFMRVSELTEVDEDNQVPIIQNDKFKIIAYIRVIKDTTGVLWYDFSEWDSKKRTGYVGLKNQGATCYMNSLLQSLNFISLYKKATFKIPTENEQPTHSVPLALQRIFYNLQHSNTSVDTRELTSSFGWDTMESFMQHDIQEFNRVLQDNLEDKMKKTEAEGAISNIFKGKMKSYIKCVDVEYTSSRVEDYYDIQLNVKGCKDVIQSFNEYIDVETLEGDNKYMAEGYGLQVAKKGVIFQTFPPVLQLHLKRFEYDIERDAMVKINDRYEYPETLNLSKYLENYKNKDSPENEYVLYGVLVHSGDNNSGHYCAFIRPRNDNKWFKFDDDNVFPVTVNDVFEENFGGKSIFKTNNKMINRYVNAYMLIYIRKKEIANILTPLSEKDIPKHIGEQIQKEQEEFLRRQKIMEEERRSLKIYVVTDKIIENHAGFDLFNINNCQYPITQIPEIQIFKTATYGDFITILQKNTKYARKDFRLWEIHNRPNNSFRISKILQCDDDNEKMEDVLNIANDNMYGPNYVFFYMEIADPECIKAYNEPFLPLDQFPNQCLLFAKYFDVEKKTMVKVQKITIKDTEKPIMNCVPLLNEMAGLPVNTSLTIFEETYSSMIDLSNLSHSFKVAELGDGDILCFEKKITEEDVDKDLMTIPQYFEELSNQRMVVFRCYNNMENRPDIQLTLSRNTSYEKISEILGQHINEDPKKIQFITSNRQQIKYSPKIKLHEIINNESLLYYNVLSIPLVDFENIVFIQFDVLNNKHQVQKSHSIMLPGNSTISDLYDSIFNKMEIDPESKEGRSKLVYCTCDSRILTIIKPDNKPIQTIHRNSRFIYYVEDMEEREPNSKIISVVYFENNITNFHGIPFLFEVKKDETFGDIKKRLSKCVPLTEKELSGEKIFLISKSHNVFQVDDDQIPEEDFIAIGFDCIDRARYRYPADKGLKINN